MKTNIKIKSEPIYTHEGAKAVRIDYEKQLRRSVMTCMLWEKGFYEDGITIADRIAQLVPEVHPDKVAEMAIDARWRMKLRHVPLLLVREMAKLDTHKHLVSRTLNTVIQRPDELSEFLSLYWANGRCPLSNQVKKGLAKAFTKFNEYQLGKWNKPAAIKLRDVLFLCHAKPKDVEQELLWKKLIDNTLAIPDTWEVALSSGADKKETWERLISENKLGSLALLRNLRNMTQVDVNANMIRKAINEMKTEKILPFRFIAAANHVSQFEPELESAMFKCLSEHKELPGRTLILIDVSGSMGAQISSKSEITYLDAACGVAMMLREISEGVDVFTFSNEVKRVPARRGFALKEVIINSQYHAGTYLGKAIEYVNNVDYDRLIVITDEQSHDKVPNPKGKAYLINVASNKNGVGYYNNWTHIDGWSEACLDFIQEYEEL